MCRATSPCASLTRSAQGLHLRGRSMNLTLYWNVMPIVGRLSTGKHVFPSVTLPAECARPCGSSARSDRRIFGSL